MCACVRVCVCVCMRMHAYMHVCVCACVHACNQLVFSAMISMPYTVKEALPIRSTNFASSSSCPAMPLMLSAK